MKSARFLWVVAIIAASCSGEGVLSDDYVPPIGGGWHRLEGTNGGLAIGYGGDPDPDPNFFTSGPVTVDFQGEARGNTPPQGKLEDGHIVVNLGGGETITLDIVSNTQIVRQPGGETYWKTFVPDLNSGYWCVEGQPGRTLIFQGDGIGTPDATLTYAFALYDNDAVTQPAVPNQTIIGFFPGGDDDVNYATDNNGELIMSGRVMQLFLPWETRTDWWIGTFDGASVLRLTRGMEKLTLVRRLLPIACD